jgi:hypothetical protein
MRKLMLLLLTLSVFVLGGGIAHATPVKVSGNAIYSWWNHPIATKVGSDTYFTGITDVGAWRVFKNSSTTYTTLDDDGDGDDHNAPTILAKSGSDTIAFYTRHGTQNYVSYRKAAEGTLSFGSRQYVYFSGDVAYSQVLNNGNTIVLFTRVGTTWEYSYSTDYGDTWSTSQTFYESVTGRVYLNFQESETTAGLYHFAAAYNPDNPNPHYIAYGQLNIVTGDVSNTADGVFDNIYSPTGLPFRKGHLDDLGVIQNDDQHVRLLDVGDKYGKTVVYYAKWDGGITSRYYYAVHNTDGTWSRYALGIYTGKCFTPTEEAKHYIGGLALNRNGTNTLYVSHESGGTWYLQSFPINSDLTIGTANTIDTSTTYPLVRPYAIHGANTAIYQELHTYDTFKQYLSWLYTTN